MAVAKPIHMMVAIDLEGKLLRAELVEHHEPIVLIGIPESKIRAMTDGYVGLDIVAEAAAEGVGHDVDIISGATVTIMIIDDSVVRASIKVARALGLGGLDNSAAENGPTNVLNMEATETSDWDTLLGDGSVRRLTLDIGQINDAFAATGDPRVLSHAEEGAPDETYIDLNLALVSAPGIGLSLMGENAYNNLTEWMEEGDNAIMLAGRGLYSFKGSGYVRGGIFDRIQLVQGDISVRFRDPAPEMLELLSICSAINARTGGAFDPTIQPLWALYAERFSAGSTPSAAEIAAVNTGWQHVQFSPAELRFAKHAMALTLNGIAQGFIADKVAAFFRAEGVENVLVNTGEIMAVGTAPNGSAWPVTIANTDGEIAPLSNAAMATSAPLGTVFDPAATVGHILDPRTGQPGGQWAQVSVTATSAALADGLSTAFCLMSDAQMRGAGAAGVLDIRTIA